MICSFGLSDSVIVKLSKLFLSWGPNTHGLDGSLRLKNSFTHADLAGMIGSTRETVTRALREMRERGLVTLKGSDLVIHEPFDLRRAAGLCIGDSYRQNNGTRYM
jgi:CRP-like cAMP-binding protein